MAPDNDEARAARGLRSRLTKYGDDDFALFLRQAFLKAKGLDADAFSRPIVGICDTSSDFNPCHATAPGLVKAISRGVEMAGGLPMAFPTISLHESFSFPTSMYLRNLMSMDVEEMLNALPLDAVVLIGGCDKTVPAQLMGAISANVPTVAVVVGPMLTGTHEGERLGACTDCRRLWGEYRAGALAKDDLARAHDRLMPSHGTCMVMGTASTMACLSEVLGFMLPGSASIPAVHSEALRNATAAGRRAVELAKSANPVLPSDLVTKTSIRNAVITLQALGGSTNAVIHLMAIARRAGINLDLEQVDDIGRRTPVLSNLKPVGTHYMEDFHAAGGLPALLRNLRSATTDFDDSALAGDGQTWAEVLAAWPTWSDDDIIRKPANPVLLEGALVVLRGSIAPNGAVLKRAGIEDPTQVREGPALVFSSLEDLERRIDDPNMNVTADHVLVLQGAGPIGAPGMPEAGSIPIPKKLAAQGVRDMVRISDGRMSGTGYGTVVLHVSPESAAGGPLALIRDGDIVRLDIDARRLDLLVDESEMAVRRRDWTPPAIPKRGYARLFHQSVEGADRGCDFDFLSAMNT